MPTANLQISQITLPSGTVYDLKDRYARTIIEGITGGNAIVFKGVSTTQLTENGNQLPTIDGQQVTPTLGELYFYGTEEFIWANGAWHALGSLDSLGDLAYKNTASGNYQPQGTISKPTFTGNEVDTAITVAANANGNYTPAGEVSQPTFSGNELTSTGTYTPAGSVSVITESTSNKTATVGPVSGTATYTPEGSIDAPTISVKTAGSTTTIKNPTSVIVAKTVVAAAPNTTAPANAFTYYSVENENLSLYQLGYTTGDSITTSNVTVKNGDASYEATGPVFHGTGVCLKTGNIAVPNTYTATLTGTEGTISVSGTPSGTVSKPDFAGTKVKISGKTTATGEISVPAFTGTSATITVS